MNSLASCMVRVLQSKMALVCLCLAVSRVLVIPWTICSVTPGKMFVSLYENLCAWSLELFERFASELGRTRLVATFVGQLRINLSAVDSKLPVDEVCADSLDLSQD